MTEEQSETVLRALVELYEWYDRDGSVGGASEVFEKHRDGLARILPPSPEMMDEVQRLRQAGDITPIGMLLEKMKR